MSDNYFITVEEARNKLQHLLKPIAGFEYKDLFQALNKVLDQDVVATFSTPPYDNSAMDGYALCLHDKNEYQLVGHSYAGHPSDVKLSPGECIRIMTGAKIPDNCNAVVMQENVQLLDEQTIQLQLVPSQGENIRYKGEDLKPGQIFLERGKRLSPSDLAFLASQGVAEVRVKRPLRVAFFSTGDELCSINQPLQSGQIYDANRYSIYGMLKQLHLEIIDMGIIRDQADAIEEAFIQAADNADIVITSGGVSVGDADYVTQTLEKLGKIDFWKISMKPGKPLAFGKIKNALFIGLPGNPVSVITTFYQIAQPAIRLMSGEKSNESLIVQAVCTEKLKKRPGRTDFQRGIFYYDEQQQLCVKTAGAQSSHILTAMSRANCYIILDKDSGSMESGELVNIQPFEGLLPA